MSAFRPDNLVEERDFLFRSIEDLERERAAGDITEEDYRELYDYYWARAAAVERMLNGEALESDLLALADEVEDSAPRPRRRPVIVAVSVLLAAVLAGWGVSSSWGERLPGESATGTIELTSTERLARARQLLSAGNAVEAIKIYDAVLRDDPENPEALAYRGWLLRLAKLPDRGLVFIERAIAADPSYPDAHFFKAMILYEDRRDPAAAIPEFRAFLATRPPPDIAARVQAVLDRALSEVGKREPGTTAP